MNLREIRIRLRRLYNDGQPLNITAVKRHRPELMAAAYGSSPYLGWKRALADAGVTYDKINVEVPDTRCEICEVERGILTAHVEKAHEMSGSEYLSR